MTIDPRNAPILAYPDDHPAKRFLLAHQRFRTEFGSFEVQHAPDDSESPDVAWHSQIKDRRWQLSWVLYAYFSVTLVLSEWIEQPPEFTDTERLTLSKLDECRSLVEECLARSNAKENPQSMIIANRMLELLDSWELSIRARLPDRTL